VSVCVSWKTSGISKFADVLEHELIVGGTGQAADTDPISAHPQRRPRHQVQDR
jgi:hypothetical protein